MMSQYVTISGDTAVISVTGKFDFLHIGIIMREMESAFQEGVTKVIVDLAETKSIDAAAVKGLIKLYRRVKPDFKVVNVKTDSVYMMLQCLSLDGIWEIPALEK